MSTSGMMRFMFLVYAVSIGITLCSEEADSFAGLLPLAQKALNSARSKGTAQYPFYNEAPNSEVANQASIGPVVLQYSEALNASFNDARRPDNFSITLEPVIGLQKRKQIGGRVLLQWRWRFGGC